MEKRSALRWSGLREQRCPWASEPRGKRRGVSPETACLCLVRAPARVPRSPLPASRAAASLERTRTGQRVPRPSLRGPRPHAAPLPETRLLSGGRRSGASAPRGPPRQNKGMWGGGGEQRRPPSNPSATCNGLSGARPESRSPPDATQAHHPQPGFPADSTGLPEGGAQWGHRDAALEVAIGGWRHAAPCRPGAPTRAHKVGRDLTLGAWRDNGDLENDYNYLGQ
jgi:hypothetical protein